MNTADFFSLSLGIQTALGSGYLAYATAYAGLRENHKTEDTVFISLGFGVIAMLVYAGLTPILGEVASVVSAVSSSLICAAIWRRLGRKGWLWCMSKARVHREDGHHGSWASIVQADRAVEQISVHLKGGRILYLNDRSAFSASPWEGIYLGGDGSVIMAVQEEEDVEGNEEIREGIVDDVFGTRLTYIPAGEISRVNIRMK